MKWRPGARPMPELINGEYDIRNADAAIFTGVGRNE